MNIEYIFPLFVEHILKLEIIFLIARLVLI